VLRDGQQLQFTLDKTTMTNYDFANHSSGHRLGTEPLSPGYLDLPEESGYHPGFAAETQKLISQIDSPPVCGWIIDLRGTYGGDFWIYLEALGPILGEGKLGGFVYANGKREPWAYTNGVVVWNGQGIERSIVGPNYRPAKATPVALLTGPATQAASELLVVAFKGRSDVRTFGEPTRGLPTLVTSTTLPDGVMLIASGAFSYDRNEKQYDGPINPDVPVESNWSHRGTDQDPATQAAAAWLASQPACKP
jgi:C-terminal processing protease CtpA/Prc